MTQTPVNPADAATTATLIEACGRTGTPVLLWSDPGTGKSSLIRGIAAQFGMPCEIVYGSIREPADIGGLPVIGDDGVSHHPPAWAKRLAAAGRGLLDLAELSTCTPEMQAAMLGVALDKQVGDITLPDDVWVVADANPVESAAAGWDLAPPLANRFCHLDFRSPMTDWIHGMTTGWTTPPPSRALPASDESRKARKVAEVVGFMQARASESVLHNMPSDASTVGRAWPSHRTWAMLAAAMQYVADTDDTSMQALTYGLVGQGVGVEFLAWRRQMDLPDPLSVINDPSIMDWTGRPDRVWAVLTGVVGYVSGVGTPAAWKAAWAPLVAAAEAGAADVAGAAARQMDHCRPVKATVPASVRKYRPLLDAAGLAA